MTDQEAVEIARRYVNDFDGTELPSEFDVYICDDGLMMCPDAVEQLECLGTLVFFCTMLRGYKVTIAKDMPKEPYITHWRFVKYGN